MLGAVLVCRGSEALLECAREERSAYGVDSFEEFNESFDHAADAAFGIDPTDFVSVDCLDHEE